VSSAFESFLRDGEILLAVRLLDNEALKIISSKKIFYTDRLEPDILQLAPTHLSLV